MEAVRVVRRSAREPGAGPLLARDLHWQAGTAGLSGGYGWEDGWPLACGVGWEAGARGEAGGPVRWEAGGPVGWELWEEAGPGCGTAAQ